MKICSFKHLRGKYSQGRIQDFAQGGDRIQEEGENQVTYQSIGIWMF